MQRTKRGGFFLKAFNIVLIIIAAYVFLQVVLYLNLLIGNDLAIKVDVNKRDLFLVNGQEEKVNFKVNGIANPFCKTKCTSYFYDIGKNYTIAQNSFGLKPKITHEESYVLTSDNQGKGQELYRFMVTCHNEGNQLCHTTKNPITRSTFLTLNYDLNQESNVRISTLKSELENKIEFVEESNSTLSYLSEEILAVNSTLSLKEAEPTVSELKIDIENFILNLENAISYWQNQDYDNSDKTLGNLEVSSTDIENSLTMANDTIFSLINSYNAIIENITEINNTVKELKQLNFNASVATEINDIIKSFNQELITIKTNKEINTKQIALNKILQSNIQQYKEKAINDGSTISQVTENLLFDLEKIIPKTIKLHKTDLVIENPKTQCCLFGKCEECCENCMNKNYPIIFLHGHDFNQDVSADYSLNAFDKLQQRLDKDLIYLNAGEFALSTPQREKYGVLGLSNLPVSFRASYYFDVLKKSGSYIAVQTKSENIDTYSIRLKELIEQVKYETGKDKVTLIGHSMGGLVARRYVQLFGNSSVDKVVLIVTPNKGVVGKINTYCSVFGSSLECEDLNSESLFISKVNSISKIGVQTYNIYGSGCEMDEGNGDGIVLSENAKLDLPDVENYEIKGTCSGINLLHGEIFDVDKYPESYEKLKTILNNNLAVK